MYGIVFTSAGEALLASLGTGEALTITRCAVGSGTIGSITAAKALTDLVQPVASATSTVPIHTGNHVLMQVEYRNSMDGGLDEDFEITEFGVWAQAGSQAEVMLLRGDLSSRPQPVSAYGASGLQVIRFPLSVAVSGETPVVLGYSAMAFMTAEDVADYCMMVVLPLFLEEVDKKIAAHNSDPEAHPDLRSAMDALDGRLGLLELQYSTDVTGNPWDVTFEDLEGLVVTGVWNKPEERMEF